MKAALLALLVFTGCPDNDVDVTVDASVDATADAEVPADADPCVQRCIGALNAEMWHWCYDACKAEPPPED